MRHNSTSERCVVMLSLRQMPLLITSLCNHCCVSIVGWNMVSGSHSFTRQSERSVARRSESSGGACPNFCISLPSLTSFLLVAPDCLRKCSRVTRPHGNSGVVKSKFASNLPPHAFGASVRVVSHFDQRSNSMAPIHTIRSF